MSKQSNLISTSLNEYRVLPELIKEGVEPSLETRISGIDFKIPFLSAAMESVTGPRLAIELAKQGGMGIIYCNQTIKKEAGMVKKVKNYRAGFVEEPLTIRPNTTLKELFKIYENTGLSTYPITSNGKPNGKYEGIIFSEDFRMHALEFLSNGKPKTNYDNLKMTAREMTRKDINTYTGDLPLKQAFKLIRDYKQKCLPIISSKGYLKSIVFRKDILDSINYPNQLLDEKKSLMVGAAINTHDYEKRVPELVKAGADLLSIDASQGFSEYQKKTISFVKNNFPEIPIIGGNVITRDGFRFLADLGVDAMKVGMGGGSICTTQEVKRIGRGQATAVIECAKAREGYENYIPIISDGGIVHDGHIFIALALGADMVMMGRYFARFDESPTEIIEIQGNKYKPYWGEGSVKAMNKFRYNQVDKSRFVAEGVEGYVPYAGRLEEGVKKTTNTILNAMKTAGRYTIKELHEAEIELISEGSKEEGKPHDIILNL